MPLKFDVMIGNRPGPEVANDGHAMLSRSPTAYDDKIYSADWRAWADAYRLQMLLIDFPLFIASTMSVSTFYLMSQKELYPKSWYMSILYIPFVMALGGVGLTITNTKAVLEKIGMRWEAVFRKHRRAKNRWWDCHLFVLPREVWEAARVDCAR